jgi:phage tail sheath protein FI
MPTYSYPGIYVEEVPSGARPIEAVGTSTAAFIGVAPNPDARQHEAYAVNNWTQFLKIYGGEGAASTPLSNAVFGFFQNGGSRCYIVNVGPKKELVGNGKQRKGIATLEEVDEVAIVAAPGFTDPASYDAILTHCETLGDRVAILDAPEIGDNFAVDQLIQLASTGTAKSKKATDAAAPPEPAPPPGGLKPRMSKGGYGAFYFPWITINDPLTQTLVDVPPSGHIAGIYARTDATRGVHKAPANETVRGALDVTYNVTRSEQGVLNPEGVNCLRKFATQGILVWGARTLDDKASPFRYIPVRRFFNQVEESVMEGSSWVVFEPNDRSLWKAIRRDISAFLTVMWRQGALMGATPEEAFFVKCDEETNPPEEIDQGKVTTIVGLAPVKPAEFVIFRIGQTASGAQIESEGGA